MTDNSTNGNSPFVEERKIQYEFGVLLTDSQFFSVSPQSHALALQNFRSKTARFHGPTCWCC